MQGSEQQQIIDQLGQLNRTLASIGAELQSISNLMAIFVKSNPEAKKLLDDESLRRRQGM